MHYRGGAPVLWRSPDTIQVGSSRGTVVCGLSAREQRFLSSLPEFISPESVRADARAAGLTTAQARSVLGRLRQVGALVPGHLPTAQDEVYWERVADLPQERTRALRRGVVALVGNGGLTGPIARLLARCAVGTVLLRDPTAQDLVKELEDLGVRTTTPRRLPDLVLTVEGQVIDPLRARRLSQLAHLPVTCGETAVRVGPLLGPQASLCVTCLGLWEREADPDWPNLATQLRTLPAPVMESLLSQQAAALAVRAATDVLTGRGPIWLGRSVELSALDPVGLERLWDPHPECVCSQVTEAPPSQAPDPAPAQPGDQEAEAPGAVSGAASAPPGTPGTPGAVSDAPGTPGEAAPRPTELALSPGPDAPGAPSAQPGRTPGA